MPSHKEIAFEFGAQPWLHIKIKINLNFLQLKLQNWGLGLTPRNSDLMHLRTTLASLFKNETKQKTTSYVIITCSWARFTGTWLVLWYRDQHFKGLCFWVFCSAGVLLKFLVLVQKEIPHFHFALAIEII